MVNNEGPLYRHEYPSDGVVNRAYHGIQGQSGEADGKKLVHCEVCITLFHTVLTILISFVCLHRWMQVIPYSSIHY
jgi:hypothetical protein